MKMWVLLEFDFPVMCVDWKEKKKTGKKIEKEEEKGILVISLWPGTKNATKTSKWGPSLHFRKERDQTCNLVEPQGPKMQFT